MIEDMFLDFRVVEALGLHTLKDGGPKDHIKIRILHPGSKAQDRDGFQQPLLVGSLRLGGLSAPELSVRH